MSQSDLGRQRLETLDMVDVLLWSNRDPKSIPSLDGVKEVPGLRCELILLAAGLPVVLDPSAGQEIFLNCVVGSDYFEYACVHRETVGLLIGGQLLFCLPLCFHLVVIPGGVGLVRQYEVLLLVSWSLRANRTFI